MRRVIVTGATSMLGVATMNSILENKQDAEIYAIVRPSSSRISRLPSNDRIHIVECEAEEYKNLASYIHDPCDVLYNFAWMGTGKTRDKSIVDQSKNITICLETLQAAHDLGCKKFVGVGSQAEYGVLHEEKITPTSPVNPVLAYGIAKYAAGRLSLKLAERLDMDCLWVRVFSVYGPNDKETTLVSSVIDGLLNNTRVPLTPAEQRWDYLYSSDAGKAFYLIGEKSEGHKVYCLGSGQARVLKEYILEMQRIANPNCPVGIGDKPYPENCVMELCADISDLQCDTGWKPEVSFEDGIRRIIKGKVDQRKKQ